MGEKLAAWYIGIRIPTSYLGIHDCFPTIYARNEVAEGIKLPETLKTLIRNPPGSMRATPRPLTGKIQDYKAGVSM
jgi:hypothetical protein